MREFGLVAIDVDGVLRDTSRLFYECHKRALRTVGLEEEFSRCFDVRDIWHFKGMGSFSNKKDSLSVIYAVAKAGKLGRIRRMIYGVGAEAKILKLANSCKERPSADELNLMVKEYVNEAMAKSARSFVRLYPGVPKTISRIKARAGKIAIVSNSDILTIERDLKHLLPKFDYVVSSRDVKVLKPSGEGLRLLSKMSNVRPDRIAYIGDTVVDIRAAKDAGCIPISTLCGMGLESYIRKEKPELVFKDLKDAAEQMFK